MRSHLDWPFFEPTHRALARQVWEWCEASLGPVYALDGVDAQCRALVAAMGGAGFLRHSVPAKDGAPVDVRGACVLREVMAQHWGLADFACAMQGLGSGPVTIFGTPAQRSRFAARAAAGQAVAAFAISEAGAGSDLAAISTRAVRDGAHYVIEGEKTWISNAGIADFYVVFARTADSATRHLSAFIVEADNPGLSVIDRIDVASPHPLGTVRLHRCRVSADARVGEEGRGLAVALGTLDVFRPTVGAAALGFARRALAEARRHARERRAFGGTLADLDGVRRKLGSMATTIDAGALLVYRAAWLKDTTGARIPAEAAMAKSFATEGAQHVIDDAVQILGARGVVSGSVVEELYREIRPLRIYEGATEIQEMVIARELLADDTEEPPS
ncbi:MAG TPA: acyl-CoA dehydrogenase family protein [Candidatus Krumholzibacteria bacterium]|nr:acyl-CoA dehydrogenase family protein [Candidatus Krumholzibacteria bacterium]